MLDPYVRKTLTSDQKVSSVRCSARERWLRSGLTRCVRMVRSRMAATTKVRSTATTSHGVVGGGDVDRAAAGEQVRVVPAVGPRDLRVGEDDRVLRDAPVPTQSIPKGAARSKVVEHPISGSRAHRRAPIRTKGGLAPSSGRAFRPPPSLDLSLALSLLTKRREAKGHPARGPPTASTTSPHKPGVTTLEGHPGGPWAPGPRGSGGEGAEPGTGPGAAAAGAGGTPW